MNAKKWTKNITLFIYTTAAFWLCVFLFKYEIFPGGGSNVTQLSTQSSENKVDGGGVGEVCASVPTFSRKPLPLVALASFPASGSTWARHLIQLSTGLYTGSIYCDMELRDHGFAGECTRNRSVVAVKTHETSEGRFKKLFRAEAEKSILLMRNPFKAIRAFFGYELNIDKARPIWESWVWYQIKRWSEYHLYWLTEYEKPLCIIKHDHLEADIKEAVYKMSNFLGYKLSAEKLECVADHSMEYIKRENVDDSDDPYTEEMRREMDKAIRTVEDALVKFNHTYCV